MNDSQYVRVEQLPVTRWLFESKAASSIWLVVRLWIGYEWLQAGWGKVFGAGREAWMGGGAALKGFATAAIQQSQVPDHPRVAYGWYVEFLKWIQSNASWMAKIIAVGEVLIGAALMLGLLTGIAAFAGLVLNFSFVFAGSAGVNPAFIIVGLFLVLAWRNAGHQGIDRFLLPALGTPWKPGPLLEAETRVSFENGDASVRRPAIQPTGERRPVTGGRTPSRKG